MPRRGRPSTNQLDLLGDTAPDQGWWRCQGIFTPHYIRRLVDDSQFVLSPQEARPLYDKLKSRWLANLPGLRKQGEPYTRTKFLDPSLLDLGWHFIPEKHLPEVKTKKKPDYCLFPDEQIQQRVAASDATDIFRASSTVLEAKKAQHSLDKLSSQETPGWFPSQQIQDYLRWAVDETGGRFFRWAILTNANEWRLYCHDAAPDAYFAFHLAHDEQFCPLEDFGLFVTLFRPQAFDRNGQGRCLLDAIREESLTRQAELETNLRKRIFDVLEELAEGFFHNPPNGLKEADLPAVYQTSLIFLYRLLFVLYAESRGLLPAKRTGVGSNKRYREEYSLARFVDRLRDSASYPDDAFDGLYKELLKLFHLVNGTNRTLNERLDVTRYNGNLFSPENHPNIESCWVGERSLANVLRQLTFAQPPSRARTRQQVITTDETLDYSTLEVRQLGDIYEGLLGGRLAPREGGRLELVNERGENQREGIFYTPDWVVVYLVEQTLQPLLDEIEKGPLAQAALKAKSREKREDNSFAYAVLRLNIVDPAMGSGHFLVRATEFLARAIVYHPTTRRMTEQIAAGRSPRSREQILAEGRIPVPPGISQEQAETGYWRRRVVEACIYGVDKNPLAVELAKLSLWLTCIALEEPLNFLDHHLRCGNSLLGAEPHELGRLPARPQDHAAQATFAIEDDLTSVLREVIQQNVDIETEASTEMEVVKEKERLWKEVRAKLRPFLEIADLWVAVLDGLPMNDLDYRILGFAAIDPHELTAEERSRATKLRRAVAEPLTQRRRVLGPFHWQLEFPDVFYQPDGRPLPESVRGFDAVLGNPPYVSTHTSSEEQWRQALESRAGHLEDLYVHFTELGFRLLRLGGMFGFIVSDTFFTLASKERMRELLQRHHLITLGQCDPFEATVDAAIFVAAKAAHPAEDCPILFVQARRPAGESRPEKELPKLPASRELRFTGQTPELGVRHGSQGCLRLHQASIRLYRGALKRAFFEPHRPVLELYRRYNDPLKRLVDQWWERIETSQKFADNLEAIRAYQSTLEPGDITLVGLAAEGGQGMRTANNSRFLGYLAATPQAEVIARKREEWTHAWLAHSAIKPVFLKLLAENGGDPKRPTANIPAWEACVEPLKVQFDSQRNLGLRKMDLYRVVPRDLVAEQKDFEFAWRHRKGELLDLWRTEPQLAEFWGDRDLLKDSHPMPRSLRRTGDVTDEALCELCRELLEWWERENDRRRTAHPRRTIIPRDSLGLRSGEIYTAPTDAPRIATIFNGLPGRRQWVPYRKGDPEGNRWASNDPLYILWGQDDVRWLFSHSGRPEPTMPVIRNAHLYFTEGVTWTAVANHAPMKARYQEPCVFDADSMRLTPRREVLDPLAFLALLNSDVVSFFKMKFVKHTQKWEIGDLRMLPLVVPTTELARRLAQLGERAIAAKQLTFSGGTPSVEFVTYVRTLSDDLLAKAPSYLRPDAQLRLLATAHDCLATIELAVNWEAEKLFDVEGLGPFDEF